MEQNFTREIGGRTLTVGWGKLAEQAGGAVTVSYGDTLLLSTVCTAQPREGIDFFPLTVDFEERSYAAGKIPGSFFRREGRPSQDAILAMRITDRCLRPLFPKGFRDEVQVITSVFSVDQENPPEVLSILGASTALTISEIPFDGPVAATRIGYVAGELIVNPLFNQVAEGDMDLVVAGTRDAVVMVEAGANEVPESVLLDALRLGQEVNLQLIELQEEIAKAVGKSKKSYQPPSFPEGLESSLASLVGVRVGEIMGKGAASGEKNTGLKELEDEAVENLSETYEKKLVASAFDGLLNKVLREKILNEGKRPDGRGLAEIRPITAEVGLIPRTHGSGLFTRGQTQILSLATLGNLGQNQRLDTLSPFDSKRFLHHYNFLPYSTGEVRRMSGPGRREIGHGALAERAMLPVIPDEEKFPYTIRLVSECLSSNGSTSMGSICGSVLALMDAGVPIKAPVAGVAMGLILGEDGKFAVLTDIQGLEDFKGDMDFKVAGTSAGVTALQMDVKVKGITFSIMETAMTQAKEGRLFILNKMLEAIDQPRENVSDYAPKIVKISIPPEKIGAVIGPGGRTIRAIIERTKATIEVQDDGSVLVGSVDAENARQAVEAVEGLVRDPEVGQIYKGKVTRLMNFGAFVEFLPGKEGLVHISELAEYRVEEVKDEVDVGDEIIVMITEVDRMGRINLSRRAVDQESGQASPGGRSTPLPQRNDGGRDGGSPPRGRPPVGQSRGPGRDQGRGAGPRPQGNNWEPRSPRRY